jgi:hypothetical protein
MFFSFMYDSNRTRQIAGGGYLAQARVIGLFSTPFQEAADVVM